MDKTMPPPPKIAKLWVTRRLLSWKMVKFGNPTDRYVNTVTVNFSQKKNCHGKCKNALPFEQKCSRTIRTCNHARTVLCITSWIVNRRPRTASCSSNMFLVHFLILSKIALVALPLKCLRSSSTISSLAWSDHLTLITYNRYDLCCYMSWLVKYDQMNNNIQESCVRKP